MQPVRKVMSATHFKKACSDDGKEKWTPCSPGDPAAVEKTWAEVEGDELHEPPLRMADFIKSLASVRPTITQADINLFVTEEIVVTMPNLEVLYLAHPVVFDGFMLPDPDGPNAHKKLLPSLRRRKNISVVSGDLLVDGRPLGSDFAHGTTYAEQMDVHEGTHWGQRAIYPVDTL